MYVPPTEPILLNVNVGWLISSSVKFPSAAFIQFAQDVESFHATLVVMFGLTLYSPKQITDPNQQQSPEHSFSHTLERLRLPILSEYQQLRPNHGVYATLVPSYPYQYYH